MDTKLDDIELYDNDVTSVKRLLDASQRLIKVNTDPPIYLGSKILYTSKTLMHLSSVYCLSNDKAINQGHTMFLELDNTDDIPIESWEALDDLIEKSTLPASTVSNTIIDDILYLLNKYEIRTPSLPFDKPTKLSNRLCNTIYSSGIFPRLDSNKANPTYYKHVVNAYAILLRNKEENILENLYKNNVDLIKDVFSEYINPSENRTKNKSKKSKKDGVCCDCYYNSVNSRIQRNHMSNICYKSGIHAKCGKDEVDSGSDEDKEKSQVKVKSKKLTTNDTDSDSDEDKGKAKSKKLTTNETDSDSDEDKGKAKSKKLKKDETETDSDT